MKKLILIGILTIMIVVLVEEMITRKDIKKIGNITSLSDVEDTSFIFSDSEKITAKEKLNLTMKEAEAMTIVLSNETLGHNQIEDFVSALNKQQKEKILSSDEKKDLIKGDATEKMKYLTRKKIMDK